MDISPITRVAGIVIYVALGLVAVWGAFCVILVWRRVAQSRFRNADEQSDFLDTLDQSLANGDFDAALQMCEGDERAMPQLATMAIANRDIGYSRLRTMITDHFQRDVLADLDYRLSWVYTVIKSAPMLGLFGTVIGMMGAFSKLASQNKVEPAMLASDISLALITTAAGLAIAIPLVLSTASINVRIRKMEDLAVSGLTRMFETLRSVLT